MTWVIPQKFSYCSPFQPFLNWQFLPGGSIPQKYSQFNPLKPLCSSVFRLRVEINSSESARCSPLQSIAAQSEIEILASGELLKSAPIAAHFSPFFNRDFGLGSIPKESSYYSLFLHLNCGHGPRRLKSSQRSALKPIRSSEFLRKGSVILEKSSHFSTLQPIHTSQFWPP